MKIKISKNLFFLLILLLSSVSTINKLRKSHDLQKDRLLIQIKQDDVQTEAIPEETTTASTDETTSSEEAATPSEEAATPSKEAAIPTEEGATTTEEVVTDETPSTEQTPETTNTVDNVEAEQESRALQKAEENADKIKNLEEDLIAHSETVADVSDLIADIEKISEQMHETVESDKNILASIDNLTDYFTRLDMAIQQQGLESSQKLNKINNHLSKQLENQLYLQLYALQNEVTEVTEDVNKLDEKINSIKLRIPETDTFCSLFSNCFSCTAKPGCGWCSMSNKCVEGAKEGPLDGSCEYWEYGKCSAPKQCKDYKSCDMCTADISCGWCGNKEPVCMNKDIGETECLEERFIHMWNNDKTCPKIKKVMFFYVG
jgi:hypothetical protein